MVTRRHRTLRPLLHSRQPRSTVYIIVSRTLRAPFDAIQVHP